MLARNQALQIYYSFRYFLLTHFYGKTSSCALPREKEFTCPIFPQRGLSPFGIQFTWGSAQVRNSVSEELNKIFLIFFMLCSFPHIWWEQHSLAAFFVLNSSISPAFLLRNFQTILTWPAKPCIVIFACLSGSILYQSPPNSLTTLR